MAEVAFVAGNGQDLLETLEEELEQLIHERTHPAEKRIRFGNLRSEISRDNGDVANAAVVYETPGGSTTQINIVYDPEEQTFSYLSEDLDDTVISEDPHEVVQMVARHADSIPDKRMNALKKTIDIWLQEGKSRSEMFSEMNKLLQNEFLGGKITNDELKAGIQYIVQEFAGNGG
jgi:hypothetical protein